MNDFKILGSIYGIFESEINDKIYSNLLNLSDLALEKKEDFSYSLAGKIYKGAQVSLDITNIRQEIEVYIDEAVKKYLDSLKNKHYLNSKFIIDSIWAVSQYEYDYNPIHLHAGHISGIIYLKVPEQIIRRGIDGEGKHKSSRQETDGKIEFILNSYAKDDIFFTSNNRRLLITPKEKRMYLFPSWLMHTVYPFKGDGERRSVAFNLSPSRIAGGV